VSKLGVVEVDLLAPEYGGRGARHAIKASVIRNEQLSSDFAFALNITVVHAILERPALDLCPII